ncbi:LytR/AlgR family response regulator transcription factor [Enterococcus caccae]|uniref:Stage 0 sporulation protein A homolog n=1 Tax=Enterococcus caccae ATCC BAA-1240 TaxID=1158612 RepID=R3WIS6_9ENTE|nr:LytTR family DNA-binding domain-containing protein [Enterococcus caccae]EOL47746.1 hypothetical protein UC7_00996 [Enterococcus caccae ATCC BAA-1240]EOT65544.1 hypothetical protein I580_01300 [Enterococcus caccae ATCC BAA-1240]OJG27274.1 hypothetical protein RU98_GL002726 [Enterococcus caccae]
MKIAICEDNQQDRKRLKEFILQYSEEKNLLVNIDEYTDGMELIDHYNKLFDIVYLDIEMEMMNGMAAAEKLRKHDENVMIVFVTNYVQYAIRGYSVNASDFLLKPLTYFNFEEHFKKVIHQFERKKEVFISVKTNSEIKRIDVDQILFVESQGHYLYLNLKADIFTVLDTMKNMEKRLSDKGFFRCNNGYIVNLKYVRSVDKNTVDVGGHLLPISRPRKKLFMEALTDYIGDDLL